MENKRKKKKMQAFFSTRRSSANEVLFSESLTKLPLPCDRVDPTRPSDIPRHRQNTVHFILVLLQAGDLFQSIMSSSMAQSSWLPSGKYRRILIGTFLSLNSFMAIFNGSVSFSMSTITGAFMLHSPVQKNKSRKNWGEGGEGKVGGQ